MGSSSERDLFITPRFKITRLCYPLSLLTRNLETSG